MAEKVTTKERVGNERVMARSIAQTELLKTYVSMPGIVQSFDAEALTVVVQTAIQGKQELEDGTVQAVNLPLLQDVPVVFPHAGGCSITFPVKQGDECLVVFADRCIDAWWQLGGVQPQLCGRYHSLSDGFAILGAWSQATKIGQVSTERIEIRSDDREAYISIHPGTHDIELTTSGKVDATIAGTLTATVSGDVTLKAPSVLIEGDLSLTGTMISTGDIQSGTISLQSHVHSGVTPGGSNTGEPA